MTRPFLFARLLACLFACLLGALLLRAPVARAAEDLSSFAFQQHPGATVPADASFHDDAGQAVTIGRLLRGRPVILDIGYFHCPALCGLVRGDLMHALAGSGLHAGQDYTLVSVSIDPAETPADAAAAKRDDLLSMPAAGPDTDWHYLTGPADSIAAVTEAAGFRSRFDPRWKQFTHPAGLVVLTPGGVVSGYLLGLGYTPGDLRAAVLRAGNGGIAAAALPVLLLCFHYDAATGHYSLAIVKLLRLAALLTVLTLGGVLAVLHRHRPARPAPGEAGPTEAGLQRRLE